MSIAAPSAGILNFKTIPVDCTSCEYYGDLTDITDEAKRALIDSTTFHHREEERFSAINAMREPRAFVQNNSKSELLLSQEQNITCEKCGSLFVVPKSFYQMVGSYQDRIAHERSWRWKKGLRQLDGEGKLIAS